MPRHATLMWFVCCSLIAATTLATSSLCRADDQADGAKQAANKEGQAGGNKENEEKDAAAQKSKQAKLASIVLSGDLAETAGQGGLFAEIEQDLRKTIERLDKAAQDKSLAGVVLKLKDVSLGRGRIDELRAAIHRVRSAGHKVYCVLESADTAQYLIASACDQIVLPPSAVVMLPGVRVEITFYKQLFDKLEIQADFLHMGAFKGAAEPYTRDKLSDEVRQNLTAIVDDYYTQMVSTIAADRKLSEEKVKELIDRGLLSAKDAQEAGLIDVVSYADEYELQLQKSLSVEKLDLVAGYGKRKVDTDFSGPAGMIKLMQMLLGGDGSTNLSKTKKKIAVVYAVGGITTGEGTSSLFGGSQVGSDALVEALQKAEKDDNVVAIVLRIDSPGGSALASDLIWREVARIKKPIIASMGDTAASGGYYIAMAADKIFAEPGTLTGSIGVVGGKIAVEGLMKKAGITTDVIARGKNAGLLDSISKFSDSQREAFQNLLEDTYEQFTTKAAEGRKMDREKLEKLAGGQVWTGRMAKENGLVDELGTLRDAIAEAKRQAGLKEDEKIDELILPEPKSFFEALFADADEEEPALRIPALPLGQLLPEDARQIARRVETLLHIFREPAAMVMPYQLELR